MDIAILILGVIMLAVSAACLFYTMKIGGADKSARMKIWISLNSNPI